MDPERRRAPRYQLVADAEISSPLSRESLKARTSDVSLVGCFMNTMYALPSGTKVRLQLKHAGTTLMTSGAVARSEPSMGFGVSFSDMEESQRILLQKWLDEVTR
jgi:hypothetical protein